MSPIGQEHPAPAKRETLCRRSQAMVTRRNQPSSPSFSPHENTRRKLQHGPAGGRHPVCGGGRKWRDTGRAERQQAGPPRRSDNCAGADQHAGANAICRTARSSTSAISRRSESSARRSSPTPIRANASPDIWHRLRRNDLQNRPSPAAICTPAVRTVAVLSPRAQKHGTYPPPSQHQLDSKESV